MSEQGRDHYCMRDRVYWIDNARFVLIFLVVLGHSAEPLLGSQHPFIGALYRFIYLFHMPAFAALSGAVAKVDVSAAWLRKIAFGLLLPYFVFQALYALAAMAPIWPDSGPSGIATPYWLLWYLPSLACWRLLLPLFARLRYRIPLAVAIALGAGWAGDLGYYLSISRTLVFFPFFLIGWQFLPRWQSWSQQPSIRVGGACVLALLGLFTFTRHLDPHWLYGSYGYEDLSVSAVAGAAYRGLQLLGSSVAILAVLALIPHRKLYLSLLGRGSLSAYLVHGFIVKFATGAGLLALIAGWPAAAMLASLASAALLIAAGLSMPAANRAVSMIASPPWLERKLWRPGQS